MRKIDSKIIIIISINISDVLFLKHFFFLFHSAVPIGKNAHTQRCSSEKDSLRESDLVMLQIIKCSIQFNECVWGWIDSQEKATTKKFKDGGDMVGKKKLMFVLFSFESKFLKRKFRVSEREKIYSRNKKQSKKVEIEAKKSLKLETKNKNKKDRIKVCLRIKKRNETA